MVAPEKQFILFLSRNLTYDKGVEHYVADGFEIWVQCNLGWGAPLFPNMEVVNELNAVSKIG